MLCSNLGLAGTVSFPFVFCGTTCLLCITTSRVPRNLTELMSSKCQYILQFTPKKTKMESENVDVQKESSSDPFSGFHVAFLGVLHGHQKMMSQRVCSVETDSSLWFMKKESRLASPYLKKTGVIIFQLKQCTKEKASKLPAKSRCLSSQESYSFDHGYVFGSISIPFNFNWCNLKVAVFMVQSEAKEAQKKSFSFSVWATKSSVHKLEQK